MGRAPHGDDTETSERELFAPPAERALPEVLPSPGKPDAKPSPKPHRWRKQLEAFAKSQRSGIVRAAALEADRGMFALAAPVALGLGALGYFLAWAEPAWLNLLAGLAVLLVLMRAVGQRHYWRSALKLLFFVVLGASAAKFETWRADTRILGGEITTRVTGRVVDIDHLSNRRIRLLLDVISTERPKLRYQPQRIRVTTARLPQGLVAGSVVNGLAQLHPPSGPIRPQSYDFAFESYFDGVGAAGFFLGAPKLVTESEPPPVSVRAMALADNLRNAVAARIRAIIGGPEGEIAAALIVGVRAGIPEDVNEALRRTGLAHILSISGLHMALVAASIMIVLRLGMALVPGFSATHPTKKYSAVVALVVLAVYLFVSGFEVAAVRSFLMLAVMLVAVLFDRQAITIRNLAIAAVLVLLWTPHEIVGPSFQMSFAATAALIGGYAAWSGRRRAPRLGAGWLRQISAKSVGAFSGVAATAIIAGVATSIYGVWHFQRISPFTLLANLAVTPIVSFIIMPFGLLAAIAMPFGLDAPFLYVMGKGISAMLAVTEYLSLRSPVDAVGMVSPIAVTLVSAALLIATLTTTRLRLVALPFLIGGVLLGVQRRYPDVFIADDGRLIGVRSVDGDLLVSRERPNRFTSQGWQRAIAAGAMIGPQMITADPSELMATAQTSADGRRQKGEGSAGQKTNGQEGQSSARSQGRATAGVRSDQRLTWDAAQDLVEQASPDGFLCKGPLCVTRLPQAGVIAVAANAWTAQQVCRNAELVVVQAAQSRYLCGDGRANLVAARILARYGAATISFTRNGKGADAKVSMQVAFAMAEPYRPWHDHRQFSREARGLAPYQPKRSARAEPTSTQATAQSPHNDKASNSQPSPQNQHETDPIEPDQDPD